MSSISNNISTSPNLRKRGGANIAESNKKNRVEDQNSARISLLVKQALDNINTAHASTDFCDREFLAGIASNAIDQVMQLDSVSTDGWLARIKFHEVLSRNTLVQTLVKAKEVCRNDLDVLNQIGISYLGLANWTAALSCFETGVIIGEADALYYTGWIYKYHPVADVQRAKSTDLFRRASKSNYSAKYEYALHLTRPAASPRELREGKHLMKEASSSGHQLASYEYACMLIEEQSSLEDKLNGRELFFELASRGHTLSMHNYGCMLKNGTGLATPVTEEQLATAREYFTQASDRGYAGSRFELATMLEVGIGGPADPEKARDLYEISAAEGHGDSKYNLSLMKYEGRGGPVDHVSAKELLLDCTEVYSKYMLAHYLLEGIGSDKPATEEDKRTARRILKSISDKHLPALNDYASLLEEGIGIEKNEVEARRLYTLAHATNEDETYWTPTYSLAMMLLEGRGGEKNIEEAKAYFKIAAEGGDTKSLEKYIEILADSKQYEQAKKFVENLVHVDDKSPLLQKITQAETEHVRLLEVQRRETLKKQAEDEIARVREEAAAREKAILETLKAQLGPGSLDDLANAALQ